MKRKKTSTAPPNLAARALAKPLFRQRVVKDKAIYSRKIKHRKRERGDDTAPFFFAHTLLNNQ
jgi:stalled ribosome alternative rescue factor ArfA